MSLLFNNPNHLLFKDPVVIMKEIMSWLFKDLINRGLGQFDHGQSTVKNGLKAKKITLPQFFIKIFSELIQSYDDATFSGPE